MTEMTERNNARHAFHKFVTTQLASKGGHRNPARDSDPPFVEPMDVELKELQRVFLELHPEHAKYRSDIETVFNLPILPMSKEQWTETLHKLKPR